MISYRIELERYNRIEVLGRVDNLPPQRRTLERLMYENPGSRALRVIRELDDLMLTELRCDEPHDAACGIAAATASVA